MAEKNAKLIKTEQMLWKAEHSSVKWHLYINLGKCTDKKVYGQYKLG